MSALFDPVGKQVGRDGCLTFGERRYWSPDSAKFAGQLVSVRRPGTEDQMVTFWQGDDETARKYAAHLMADHGFADVDAAAAAAARIRDIRTRLQTHEAESALIVGRKVAALVQLIDERIERAREFEPLFSGGLFARLFERLRKVFGDGRPATRERLDHGHLEMERQLAFKCDLSDRGLESALTIFDVPDALFERVKVRIRSGHIQSPAGDGSKASEAEGRAHRLCGGAE